MQIDFPYVAITKKDRALVGKPDSGTRIYRQSGPQEEAGSWFDKLRKRFPGEGFISPGGVTMYAPVSRAAVYLRINSGKLTAFCYHPAKWSKTMFGGLRKVRETPWMYIPVSECQAWGDELRQRVASEGNWLSNKDYDTQEGKLDDWPKHEGKTSAPKWKRKKRAARKGVLKGVLSVLW